MTDLPTGNLLNELFNFEGRVSRAVFLTYSFDPQYFSNVIYPMLRELNCERTLVLMDATQYQQVAGLGDLHNDGRLVIEHYKPGVTFHPKLFLLTGVDADGGNIARGAIGSANLTQQGLETNRELFTILTGQSGLSPVLAELLTQMRAELRPGSTAAEVMRESIAELRAIPRAFIGHSDAEVVWNGLGAPRLWAQLKERIPTGRLKKAIIVSTFFEAPEQFDHGLIDELLKADVEVHLYVQDIATPGRIPREAIRRLSLRYASNLLLYRLNTDGQPLHGKLLALMTAQSAWLLFGSPNFTAAALRGDNVETGLLLKQSRSEADRYLTKLLTGTLLRNPDELPQERPPDPEPEPMTSGFIVSVVLSLESDCLTITLDRPARALSPDPASWSIELNGKAIPADVLARGIVQDADHIVIPGVRQYVDAPDGITVGALLITVGDHARDWRLVELAPGEVLSDDGLRIEPPHDLSAFIFGLTQPRSLLRPGLVTTQGDGQKSVTPERAHMNFADIEGRLDVAYRFANSLQAHFERLITDPYTIHRWRRDWLRTAHLLRQDEETVSPLGQRLIASRLLQCLNERLSPTRKEMHAMLTEDSELADSVRSLLVLSGDAPGIDDLHVTVWLPEHKA